MNKTKVCICCHIEKPRKDFYACGATVDKRTDKCKACYIKEKELRAEMLEQKKGKKLAEKPQKKLGIWAKGQITFCPSRTSSCWLNYDKGLCCSECLGNKVCNSPDKCQNNVNDCMKWYRCKN